MVPGPASGIRSFTRPGSALSDLEVDFDVTVAPLEPAFPSAAPVYFSFHLVTLRPSSLPVLARFGDVVTAYHPDVPRTPQSSPRLPGPRDHHYLAVDVHGGTPYSD